MPLAPPFPLAPALLAGAHVRHQARHLRLVGGASGGSDAELVDRARNGDRGAEEALYRRYAPYVLGLTTRLLGRRSEAEDAAQDTFVLALEHLDELRDPAALRGWLARIAVSQVRRRFRRQKLMRVLGLYGGADDATLESLSANGVDGEVRAELSSLDRVLATLPSEQRIAWVMRFVEGEELEDVARMCGCSLSTIKRRIAAADARVRGEVRIEAGP